MMASRRPEVAAGDRRALDDLDRAYGQVYDLAVAQDQWMACGLDTGRWLVASCPAELKRLIAADAAES
jgi:hypothetical protein